MDYNRLTKKILGEIRGYKTENEKRPLHTGGRGVHTGERRPAECRTTPEDIEDRSIQGSDTKL